MASVGRPGRPHSAAVIGLRLHGRDRALSRIAELRRRAAEGVGGVVLVAGEAGMGKTALCDAVLVDAKRDGWRVAWTAAAQASILPGLWPWRRSGRASPRWRGRSSGRRRARRARV